MSRARDLIPGLFLLQALQAAKLDECGEWIAVGDADGEALVVYQHIISFDLCDMMAVDDIRVVYPGEIIRQLFENILHPFIGNDLLRLCMDAYIFLQRFEIEYIL